MIFYFDSCNDLDKLVVNDNNNREVFTELISQRLSQNFQLIILKVSLPFFENKKIF